MNPPDSTASYPVADPYNLAVYSEANARLRLPRPGETRVVFIGDSVVCNWDLDRDFPGEGWINRGIGGQRTVEILGRFHEDALALRPQVIWMLAGTNDLATGGAVEVIVANLRKMVRLSIQHGIRMIVASLLPVSDYHKEKESKFERTKERPPEKILEINRALAGMAVQEGGAYLDLSGRLTDSSGFLADDFAADGLHPNKAAYAAIAPLVFRSIRNGGS